MFFLLSQDLQPGRRWKGKLDWTKSCRTWSATAKLRSTSCARVEISSKAKRGWRRLCLQIAKRSGRRRGNETAIPTPYSLRDRGDTKVLRNEDYQRQIRPRAFGGFSQNLNFLNYQVSYVFYVFCILTINIVTLWNVNWCSTRSDVVDTGMENDDEMKVFQSLSPMKTVLKPGDFESEYFLNKQLY